MVRRGRMIGTYALSILLMATVSIGVIPIVVTRAGVDIWAGVATAQAIAGFSAVLVAFGWGVTGPAAVAVADADARGAYFADSVASRFWLFVIIAPIMLIAVKLLAPGDFLVDALVAISLLLPSLGASWFFVGERAPWRLLLIENMPRATGTALGALALALTGEPVWFGAVQALGAVGAVTLSWRDVLSRHRVRPALHPGPAFRRLASQASGVVAAGTAALYVNLPLVVVASLVPEATAIYALADKIQKFATTAYTPVLQIAQGYVPNADPEKRVKRARRATLVSFALGIVAAVAYILLMPLTSNVLSGGTLKPDTSLAVPLGIGLGAVCVSAITGLACLTAFGAVRQVAVSTVLGAVVGVPLIVLLGLTDGSLGIAWAVSVSEVLVVGYQLGALHRILRRVSTATMTMTS